MKLIVLKKMKTFKVCVLIMLVNVICFICHTYLGRFTWHVSQKKHSSDFNISISHFNRKLEIDKEQLMPSSVSRLVRKKLNIMKKHLNDARYIDESVFPPRRIGRYLMLNPNLCKDVQHVDIVIIVHSAPSFCERRQRIRDSFGNRFLFQPIEIRTAFLLGKTKNRTLEKVLKQEHDRYKDTVMGDFFDSYHNLSLKGVMGYRWVSEHCSNSDIVLKIDDDVLVNMFKFLYSYLPQMRGKKKSIFCNFWITGEMPIRRLGTWEVESHIFSSMKFYPYNYCSGFVVIITTDIVKSMYEASLRTPFFWIDDVYLFGMLPYVVGGVIYYEYALDKHITLKETIAVNCSLLEGKKCPFFATIISDSSYWSYWNMIKEIYASTSWTGRTEIIS